VDLRHFDSLSPDDMQKLAFVDQVAVANTLCVRFRQINELQVSAEEKLRDADILVFMAVNPQEIRTAKVAQRIAKATAKVLALELGSRKRQASILQSLLRSPQNAF
jgi:hypothetical protein